MTSWGLLSSWYPLQVAQGEEWSTRNFSTALHLPTSTESKRPQQRNGQKLFSYWCLLCECPKDTILLVSYMGSSVLVWAVTTNFSLLSYQAFHILDNISSNKFIDSH